MSTIPRRTDPDRDAPDGAAGTQVTDTYAELIAARAAIEEKLTEIETTIVPALRTRWQSEAAAIGKTPEEILGLRIKTPRKRKSNGPVDGSA